MAPIDAQPEDVTRLAEELVAAYQRMYDAYTFFSTFVEERRANPGEDLASAMLKLTNEDGTPALSNDDVLAHMVGITAAGTDTTANLIGSMVRYFTESSDQLQAVREDPGLWANAVEEGLRRATIAPHLFRLTTGETEICGVRLPARQMVCLNLAAANGDPEVFPDPLRFDVRRANAIDHLALGAGRHYCLGAPLAKPEARIALQALYQRMPDLVADLDQELEFIPAITVRAMISQRVSWG